MKKALLILPLGLSLISGAAMAEHVRDRYDLRQAHTRIHQVIVELGRAARANHYEMGGHAAHAIKLLKQAEYELHEAIISKRRDRH